MDASKRSRFFKERLALLAAAQVKAKRARKQLPPAELAALRAELMGPDDLGWRAPRDVVRRRVEITACLNLYHELRGSAHRHGIRKGWEWYHERTLTRLREDVARLE